MLKLRPGCNANPPAGVHRLKPEQQQYVLSVTELVDRLHQIKGWGERRKALPCSKMRCSSLQRNNPCAVFNLNRHFFMRMDGDGCVWRFPDRLAKHDICALPEFQIKCSLSISSSCVTNLMIFLLDRATFQTLHF